VSIRSGWLAATAGPDWATGAFEAEGTGGGGAEADGTPAFGTGPVAIGAGAAAAGIGPVAAGDDKPPNAPDVVTGDDMLLPGAIWMFWMFGPSDVVVGAVPAPMNAFDPAIGITGGGVLVVLVDVPAAPVPAGTSVTPAVGTDTLALPDGVLPDQVLGLPVAGPPVAAAA